MATFYLDLENGNDANAGTSWALAWKTFTSGATAARIAPGDTIRIAKSSAPTSMGNATWTSLSPTVTLASALTTTLYNDGTWTAANTATSTTTTNRKQGTNASQTTTPASTLTSTKYAYYATGTLDLSAYNAITFWFRNNSSAVADANRYVIKLCSDTTGDTSVDEFSIPAIPSTSQWVPLTIAKTGGGNLGNSIKSIALYTGTSSPGNSQQIWIDNVSACTFSGLSLRSLISKSSTEWNFDEVWHCLQFINGTTLSIGLTNNTDASSTLDLRGYYTTGTSPATVTSYYLNPIRTPMATNSTDNVNTFTDNGSSDANLITYSGGWDTGTNTQTGMTYMDGQNGFGTALNASSRTYNKLEYVGMVRYNTGINTTFDSNYFRLTNLYVIGSTSTPYNIGGGARDMSYCVQSCSAGIITYTGYNISTPVTQTISYIKSYSNSSGGLSFSGQWINSSNLFSVNNRSYGLFISSNDGVYDTVTIDRNLRSGAMFIFSSGENNIFYNVTITNCNTSSNNLIEITNHGLAKLYNFSSSGNTVTSFIGGTQSTTSVQPNIQFYNSTFSETPFIPSPISSNVSANTVTVNNGNDARFASSINYQKYNFSALTQTTTRHTASGYAWQLNVLSTNITSDLPFNFPIAKVAVNANSLVTIKAWVKLSHATDIGAKLFVSKNQLDGMTANYSATKTADTNWEELTVTFTPTEAGVVEVVVQAYWLANAATQSVYVDDMTISQ